MNAREVARVLAEIAALSEVLDDNPFRARAFQGAARMLETSLPDLEALAAAGALTSLPRVGAGIASTIEELVTTGRSGLHERLVQSTPPGMFEVMRVPGLGLKRVRTLYTALGVDSLDALEEAARAGRVAALPGFGAKTEAKLLAGLGFARAARNQRRYPQAMEDAVRLLEALRGHPDAAVVEIAGPLRRRLEVVDSIDLVAASASPASLLSAFLGGADAPEGDMAEVTLTDGVRARLRCVPPPAFAAALAWETGSEAHRAALVSVAKEGGFAFGADGVRKGRKTVSFDDEAALYRAFGLDWVPPELREGWGEVEAAAEGRLPKLVEEGDLRGTFHCHTTYSDGRATVAEMAEAARARGWSYLGLGDHSKSAGYAGGLSVAAVRKQQREIDAWNAEHGGKGKGRFRLFKGIESDILADGSLDYGDDVLATFDYVVGSVHSLFRMPRREMTDRIVRAVSHPALTILGHATGRLLLTRSGYEVDVREVIDACAAHGVAIEINADPHRLDVDWHHARYAVEKGVLVAIDPDAHSTAALGNVAFGVNVARKGWLEAPGVLNTWTLPDVEAHLAQRKQDRTT